MTAFPAADLKLLGDLIQERFGLTFDGVRREILAARLGPRLRELHLDSPRAYYEYLRFHPLRDAEFDRLPALVTNNETYFFRETRQFDILVGHVLPERRAAAPGRPLRILSAGCSSGEEPYSVGMALQGAGHLPGRVWELDACDLNADRIARAREAVYEEGSLRACDPETRRRYFTQEGERFRVRERYRAGIRFFQANLLAPGFALERSAYDAVLCRNLLIYFCDAAFDRLIGLLGRALMPGGYLFLGHSESLFDRSTDLTSVVVAGSVVYRKPPG
ncbi:MAG TPA: protein-glutamate O-methyltransferase CheR [Gemmatimonadales bacterium]